MFPLLRVRRHRPRVIDNHLLNEVITFLCPVTCAVITFDLLLDVLASMEKRPFPV